MKLGELEFHIISDGDVWLDGGAMFGVVPKVLWKRKCSRMRGIAFQLAMNCLLVRTAGKTVLVETGAGGKMNPKLKQIYGIEGPFLVERCGTTGCMRRRSIL